MNIAIEIHGTINHGLWSPERGESRWAQNAAAVLARAGHSVDAFGSPLGWGACPPVANVYLCSWGHAFSERRSYDVVFDTAWWDGKRLPTAKRALLGFFWFKREKDNTTAQNVAANIPGAKVVMPYEHLRSEVQALGGVDVSFLPYVMPPSRWWCGTHLTSQWSLASIARTAEPHFFWGNKSPFGELDRWTDPVHPFNVWADLLLAEVERREIFTQLLNWKHLQGRHSPVASHYHAWERTVNCPHIVTHGLLPFGDVLVLMRRSAICLNLPWAGSTPLEAALEGCCPLAWKGAFIPILEHACPDKSLVLDAEHPDGEHLREVLDRLLKDRKLRERVLDAYRAALAPYSPENFLKRWDEVTDG